MIYQSGFNFLEVVQIMNNAIQPVEQDMLDSLQQLEAAPANTSQSIMAQLQAELQIWGVLTTTESSIIKQVGDTMKGIASNIGS